WLYGLYRALPGGAGLLSPSSLRSLLLKNLTPASRRQDHTTSPYALAFRPARSLAPDAKASITSRVQRVVTIMIRPSCGRETGGVVIRIYGNWKQNIFDSFCFLGLTISANQKRFAPASPTAVVRRRTSTGQEATPGATV